MEPAQSRPGNLPLLSQIYQHVNKRSDHLRKGLDQAAGHLRRSGDGNDGPDGDDSAKPPLKIVG